jgi:hypothetical protein
MSLSRRSFLFCVAVAVAFLCGGQAFAANAPARIAGAIKAATPRGTVTKINKDKTEVALRQGDVLIQENIVVTGADSSVVLVFQNGATVRVGQNSRLEIRQFLIAQGTPPDENLAARTDEPSSSDTNLRLEFGEIVGNVKTLNRNAGSTFQVTTPAGAAGIRGTTFRIVYRPTGTGQAFFQLSTSEGVVLYETTGTAAAGAAGVEVPQNQEVILNAVVDPVTNTVTITAPAGTTTISVAAIQDISAAVVAIAAIPQQMVTFTQVEVQNAQQQEQQRQQQSPPENTPPPPPPTQPLQQTTSGAGAPGTP